MLLTQNTAESFYTFTQKKHTKIIIALVVVILGVTLRLSLFNKEGGDHKTYKDTVLTFLQGINPYEYTVASFKDTSLKKGYAYLPTLLYIQTLFVKMNGFFDLDWPTIYMWKVPVLFADLLIVYIFYKKYFKTDYFFFLFAISFWLFNPHILTRGEYTLYDPLATLFLLLSLLLAEKKPGLSGLFFGISFSFKSFGVILLPIIFLRSKNKFKFILAGIILFLVISIPFMKTYHDFNTYINGALLVHTTREVQGRPILTFISFFTRHVGINFWQTTKTAFYANLAILLPGIMGIYLYLKRRNMSIFQLTLLPILSYYLLTPVLNRTHVLWFLPILLIGFYEFCTKNYKNNLKLFYLSTAVIFLLLCVYLKIWESGFHIYDCTKDVSAVPSEKASTRICTTLDEFGFSHCPAFYGSCLEHCCVK